jgi:hypothetical protein
MAQLGICCRNNNIVIDEGNHFIAPIKNIPSGKEPAIDVVFVSHIDNLALNVYEVLYVSIRVVDDEEVKLFVELIMEHPNGFRQVLKAVVNRKKYCKFIHATYHTPLFSGRLVLPAPLLLASPHRRA